MEHIICVQSVNMPVDAQEGSDNRNDMHSQLYIVSKPYHKIFLQLTLINFFLII